MHALQDGNMNSLCELFETQTSGERVVTKAGLPKMRYADECDFLGAEVSSCIEDLPRL